MQRVNPADEKRDAITESGEFSEAGKNSTTRRRVIELGAVSITGFSSLSVVSASNPEPQKFRARYQDSITCSGNDLWYSFGHEVVYDVLTTGVEFVESNTSHQTASEFQWLGGTNRDDLIEYDDGFEKQATGSVRHYLAPHDVYYPYVDIRVYSNGAAETVHKFGDCPDCINC